MPLSDREILKEIEKGSLQVEGFLASHLQPASVDVQLGPQLLLPRNVKIDVLDLGVQRDVTDCYTPYDMRKYQGDGEEAEASWQGYDLEPGEFILGATLQKVTFGPLICGHLTGRSTLGRCGLLVHATAGFCDPGFSGCITLEIKNLAGYTIRLRPGIRIGQILFERIEGEVEAPYGSKTLASGYTGDNAGPVAPNLNRPL